MKNLIIPLLISVVLVGDLSAQIEKGTFTLGGDIYFNSAMNNYEDGRQQSSLSLFFGPGFGFFPANNLELGLKTELGRTESSITYDNTSDYSESRSDFAVQLYGRKYFLQNQWKPFVELGVQTDYAYLNTHMYQTDPNGIYSVYASTQKDFYFVGVISGGVALFVRDYLSIDLLLRYKMGMYEYTIQASEYSDYSGNSRNFEIYTGVGLRYFFLKNEK